jgi:hypothetical protein
MVQNGTLHVGDVVVCGEAYGRIKSMHNTLDAKIRVDEAPPSMPVNIWGLNTAPGAGEHFYVLDDIGLARAVRAVGGRTGIADGSTLATCEMYATSRELSAGYRKSLWAAFGSPAGAVAVATALTVVYVLPAAAAVTGSRVGLLGYGAAVTGRVLAQRWCGRPLDAAAHPLSVLALLGLLASSWVGRVRGTLSWKGRAV